jgi:hypothetical protein
VAAWTRKIKNDRKKYLDMTVILWKVRKDKYKKYLKVFIYQATAAGQTPDDWKTKQIFLPFNHEKTHLHTLLFIL